MTNLIKPIGALTLFAFFVATAQPTFAADCGDAVRALNQRLHNKIDEAELTDTLKVLNASRNAKLPDKFIVKREAIQMGWKPGKNLWSIPALQGKSIGGDHFGNRERRLPKGNWREADLDYRGGHRGAKRLVFSADGMRRVTVDHYQTFFEIPECR